MSGRHRVAGPSGPRALIIPHPWRALFWAGVPAACGSAIRAATARITGRGRRLPPVPVGLTRAPHRQDEHRAPRRWHPATLIVVPLLPALALAARGYGDTGGVRFLRVGPGEVTAGRIAMPGTPVTTAARTGGLRAGPGPMGAAAIPSATIEGANLTAAHVTAQVTAQIRSVARTSRAAVPTTPLPSPTTPPCTTTTTVAADRPTPTPTYDVTVLAAPRSTPPSTPPSTPTTPPMTTPTTAAPPTVTLLEAEQPLLPDYPDRTFPSP